MDASAFSLSKAKLRTLFSSPPNRFRSMLKESERSSISGTTTRSCMMALCLSGCRRRILPPLDELAWVARTGAEYGHLASWHIYTFVQALHGSQHLGFSCGRRSKICFRSCVSDVNLITVVRGLTSRMTDVYVSIRWEV